MIGFLFKITNKQWICINLSISAKYFPYLERHTVMSYVSETPMFLLIFSILDVHLLNFGRSYFDMYMYKHEFRPYFYISACMFQHKFSYFYFFFVGNWYFFNSISIHLHALWHNNVSYCHRYLFFSTFSSQERVNVVVGEIFLYIDSHIPAKKYFFSSSPSHWHTSVWTL